MEKQNLTYYKIFIELVSDVHKVKIYLNNDYKDLIEVKKIINNFKKQKYITINNLIEEKRKKDHPQGLNTAEMLKTSSTYLGISPQATMSIAEKLYTRGYITYPRTETTQYASSFNFLENLYEFKNYSTFGKDVSNLINKLEKDEVPTLRYGFDAGDHPPITPARRPANGRLKGKDLELFDLICQYYFASLSSDLEYDNLTYEFEIDGIKYTSSCSLIQNEGFLKFLPSQKKDFIDKEDVLTENKKYEIAKMDYETRKIDSYITEAELIELMEKKSYWD